MLRQGSIHASISCYLAIAYAASQGGYGNRLGHDRHNSLHNNEYDKANCEGNSKAVGDSGKQLGSQEGAIT